VCVCRCLNNHPHWKVFDANRTKMIGKPKV
jgi:hypothetical protein